MSGKGWAWIVVGVAVAGCDAGPADPGDEMSLVAEVFLDGALDVMELNSVRKYEIDWSGFRAEAKADALGAQNPADTWPAIVAALERIGDNHSFFVSASELAASPALSTPSSSAPPAAPMSELVAPGVGYVDVPAFSGGGTAGDSLASTYHRLIEEVDTMAQVCRWVVDVRGNTGGNMWPMVAGVGPIIGSDTIGFFMDPDSVASAWIYDEGRAGMSSVLARVTEWYELDTPDPWVAVLTDSLTASSGEAVAVAFRERPGARSFGSPTWGVSTGNAAFPLNDGSVIFLTIATMADRAGTVYGESLLPDSAVGGSKTGDPATDEALAAALHWLEMQPCS